LQRLIDPREIANLIAFVASPLSSATNGAALRAKGGLERTIYSSVSERPHCRDKLSINKIENRKKFRVLSGGKFSKASSFRAPGGLQHGQLHKPPHFRDIRSSFQLSHHFGACR